MDDCRWRPRTARPAAGGRRTRDAGNDGMRTSFASDATGANAPTHRRPRRQQSAERPVSLGPQGVTTLGKIAALRASSFFVVGRHLRRPLQASQRFPRLPRSTASSLSCSARKRQGLTSACDDNHLYHVTSFWMFAAPYSRSKCLGSFFTSFRASRLRAVLDFGQKRSSTQSQGT